MPNQTIQRIGWSSFSQVRAAKSPPYSYSHLHAVQQHEVKDETSDCRIVSTSLKLTFIFFKTRIDYLRSVLWQGYLTERPMWPYFLDSYWRKSTKWIQSILCSVFSRYFTKFKGTLSKIRVTLLDYNHKWETEIGTSHALCSTNSDDTTCSCSYDW